MSSATTTPAPTGAPTPEQRPTRILDRVAAGPQTAAALAGSAGCLRATCRELARLRDMGLVRDVPRGQYGQQWVATRLGARLAEPTEDS